MGRGTFVSFFRTQPNLDMVLVGMSLQDLEIQAAAAIAFAA